MLIDIYNKTIDNDYSKRNSMVKVGMNLIFIIMGEWPKWKEKIVDTTKNEKKVKKKICYE